MVRDLVTELVMGRVCMVRDLVTELVMGRVCMVRDLVTELVMGRVCMVRDLVAELVMDRVCHGPSLLCFGLSVRRASLFMLCLPTPGFFIRSKVPILTINLSQPQVATRSWSEPINI